MMIAAFSVVKSQLRIVTAVRFDIADRKRAAGLVERSI